MGVIHKEKILRGVNKFKQVTTGQDKTLRLQSEQSSQTTFLICQICLGRSVRDCRRKLRSMCHLHVSHGLGTGTCDLHCGGVKILLSFVSCMYCIVCIIYEK